MNDITFGTGDYGDKYSTNFRDGLQQESVIGKLQFPSDIGTNERPNFTVIYINEVEGTTYFKALEKSSVSKIDQPTSAAGNTSLNKNSPNAAEVGVATAALGTGTTTGFKLAAVNVDAKAFKRLKSVIALPMPTQFSAPLNTQWGGNDSTAVSLARAGIVEGTKALAKDKLNRAIADTKTGASAFRQVINPAIESSFQSVSPRGYELTWELYPKSLEEAKAIWDIIQILKAFALPSVANGGAMLTSPAVFDFEFHHKTDRNDWLPKSLSCAIGNISVNYLNNGFTGFDLSGLDFSGLMSATAAKRLSKGSPSTGISLSVSFQEIEVLTRDRIDSDPNKPFNFNLTGRYTNDQGIL